MTRNALELEFEEISKNHAWSAVFQKLARETQWQNCYSSIEAKKPANNILNRYRNVYPFDHSRVVLTRSTENYINASLVRVSKASRRYILTQGPLPNTVSHFWCMVFEQRTRAIVMLNKVIENSEIKCHWYWPQEVGMSHKVIFDCVNLSVEQMSYEECGCYCIRGFKVTDLLTCEERNVTQFHYMNWPDFGVPASPATFLTFLDKVRESGALNKGEGPAIIHCSAGIGRSGTFCLVDSCLEMIRLYGIHHLRIQDILADMRRDRMGLIQTSDQLRFSYEAIIEGAKRMNIDITNIPPITITSWLEENEAINAEEEARTTGDYVFSVSTPIFEDDAVPPPPPPRCTSLSGAPPSRPLPSIPASESMGFLVGDKDSSSDSQSERSSSDSADDENDDNTVVESPLSEATLARRRNNEIMNEKIKEIKHNIKKNENWEAVKRSFYKPIAFTVGLLLGSILLYQYLKR